MLKHESDIRTMENSNLAVAGRQALVVVAAAVSALTVYLVGTRLLDIDIVTTDSDLHINAGDVLFVSVLMSGLGWALLMAMQRWTRHARTWWTRIAVGVTVVTLVGPLTTPDITGAGRALLCVLHLTVGAVVVGVLRPRSYDAS